MVVVSSQGLRLRDCSCRTELENRAARTYDPRNYDRRNRVDRVEHVIAALCATAPIGD